MGNVGSLGKLNKKGQVAPAGVPQTAANGPVLRGPGGPPGHAAAPVIGKRYPTYFYTTLLASFPMSCLLFFIATPFLLSCYSMFTLETNNLDVTLASFEISDHSTVQNRDVTMSAVKDWKRALDAYDFQSTTEQFGQSIDLGALTDDFDIKEPPIGSIPWKRLYIQYKVDLEQIFEISDCNVKDNNPFASIKEAHNLLTKTDYIQFMHELEDTLQELPFWGDVCFRSLDKAGNRKFSAQAYKEKLNKNGDDYKMGCVPFTSFKQYYFPGGVEMEEYNDAGESRLFFTFDTTDDKLNSKIRDTMQRPASDVLTTFYQNPSWQWFGDALHTQDSKQSLVLRTQITIGRPLENIVSQEAAEQLVDGYLSNFIKVMDTVVAVTKTAQGAEGLSQLGITRFPRGLSISYGGDGLVESQLREAKERDWWFVFAGVCVVLFVIGGYTHSFFIATMSVGQLALTYFTATFIHFYARDEDMSLLTLLSFYIMLTMSTDGVMISFNTFRQSAFMETSGRVNTLNIPQRMAFCFRKAGAALAMSHMSAAAAFIVNTVSSVPAIRDFGIFMVWLVCVNLYMFLTVFPCVLLLHHFHISRKRRNAQRQKEILLRKRTHFHPLSVRGALRQLDTVSKKANGVPTAFLDNGPRQLVNAPVQQAAPAQTEGNEGGEKEKDDENKPQVSFGDAGSRFGFNKLQAKFLQKKRVPKTAEQIKAEHEALFEQFSSTGGLRPQKCRRKQAPNGILRIPIEFTSFSRAVPRTVNRPAGGNPDSNTEAVSLEDYRDRYRAIWEEEAKIIEPSTFLGKGVFRDPVSQHQLECAKRIPMVCQIIAECNQELRVIKQPYDDEECDGVAVPAPEAPQQPHPLVNNDGTAEVPVMGDGFEQPGDVQSPHPHVVLSYTPQQQPPPSGCWEKFLNWCDQRRSVKRRFGVFGKRVGETREEKDRRILGKRAKREGYTSIERFFYNRYTPLIALIYPFVIGIYLIKLIIFAAALLSHLEATEEVPQLLDFQNQIYHYEAIREKFPVEGSCDYCGAWFRPYSDFPAPFGRGSDSGTKQLSKVTDWEKCDYQMFAPLDRCGICGGNNDCLDCMGQVSECMGYNTSSSCPSISCNWIPTAVRTGTTGHCVDKPWPCPGGTIKLGYSGWTQDDCGRCVLPGHAGQELNIKDDNGICQSFVAPPENRCTDQVSICGPLYKTGVCSRCYLSGYIQQRGGTELQDYYPAPVGNPGEPGFQPKCTVTCNKDTCVRGTCDDVTGECLCFSDYIRGFYTHVVPYNAMLGQSGDCAACLPGFQPDIGSSLYLIAGSSESIVPCTLECMQIVPTFNVSDEDCQCECDFTTPTPEFNNINRGNKGRCMCARCKRYEYLNETDVIELPDVPRPVSPFTNDNVAVGYNCTSKRRDRCVNGALDILTGECICEDDFNDGGSCEYQKSCSYHGRRDDSGLCRCYACWEGDSCERSACKNSGYCTDMSSGPPEQWKCVCNGVWEGPDCNNCPAACGEHSRCPLEWPAALYNMPRSQINKKYLECWVSDSSDCFGYWGGSKCDQCTPPSIIPQELHHNITCDPQGRIYGCDGAEATETHFKYRDNCDLCVSAKKDQPLKDSQCKGCDGISGSAVKADSCGICGGTGTCQCLYQSPDVPAPIPVELVWGLLPTNSIKLSEKDWGYGEIGISTFASTQLPVDLAFDFADRDVQLYLLEVCQSLINHDESFISYMNRHCLMISFSMSFLDKHYIKTRGIGGEPLEIYKCNGRGHCASEAARKNQERTDKQFTFYTHLVFPVDVPKYATFMFFHFVREHKYTHLVGFSSSNPREATLRVNWVRMQFSLPEGVNSGLLSTRPMYKNWESLVKQINIQRVKSDDPFKFGVAFHWSPLWVKYFTKEHAENGTIYAVVLGGVCFAAIMLVFSCSLTLTLIGIFNVTGIVIMSMSYMKAAGWTLGPSEQIGLTCLVGIACEYTVHIVEGYLEYLHASQSSLLARKTTRTHALAGALQRTGVPIFVSALAVLAASVLLLFCEILIYRRMAEIMLMVTLISAFHGLVIMPSFLICLGPITVQRNWTTRALWGATVGLCICFTLAVIFLSDNAKNPNGDDFV